MRGSSSVWLPNSSVARPPQHVYYRRKPEVNKPKGGVLRIAAIGWGRTHGKHNIAAVKPTKALSYDRARRFSADKTYIQTDSSAGTVTFYARSNSLRLSGHYQVSVELSDADVIRLLRERFKGLSAADV
jgi:hypothetical protein